MATITQSGIRYIPIGLFFCFRINYNTPIATMICSLSDEQSFGFQICNLHFNGSFTDSYFFRHLILRYRTI